MLIFCLNEIDRADDGFLTGLYEVMEGRALETRMSGADVVEPHEFFRMASTGNTALGGDSTGLYIGAHRQDIALADRAMFVEVKYLPSDQEKLLLGRVAPKLPKQMRDAMVDLANDIRAAYMGSSDSSDALPVTMSTRTLTDWAKLTHLLGDGASSGINTMFYAYERMFLFRLTDDRATKEALIRMCEGRLGVSSAKAA
jgi:cobaltochelatase CobS